jgi:hypothetical protein
MVSFYRFPYQMLHMTGRTIGYDEPTQCQEKKGQNDRQRCFRRPREGQYVSSRGKAALERTWKNGASERSQQEINALA